MGDEQYFFWIAAWRDGRLVGDLYTHDAGVHSWNYRFQVRNASLSRWVYVAGAVLLLLLVIGAGRLLPRAAPTRRRRLARRALALIVVGVFAGGAYYVVNDRVEERERRRVAEERAQSEAEGEARQRELIAAFVSAAPRPAWWASVQTPYRVDNVGDLLAAWQGFPRGDDGLGERQFFKAAYRASWIIRTMSTSWRPPSTCSTGSWTTTRTACPSPSAATTATSSTGSASTTAPTAWWGTGRRG